MSSENLAKINAARETDGKFGAQLHAVSDVAVANPERPEWLNGWPETLPVPELSFHVGDDNVITTSADIDGETFVEAWNPGDDVHSQESHAFELGFGSEEETAAAEEWIKAKHEQIAANLRAEMHDAVERARHRVMAKTTGQPVPVSDEELDAIIESNSRALNNAQEDMELAATARIARGILTDHPDAAAMVLYVAEVDDMGEVVTGVSARDANGQVLGEYDGSDNPKWTGDLANLSASNGRWDRYTPDKREDAEDWYTVDLKAASAWSPGTR